jgi:hypothetical protein
MRPTGLGSGFYKDHVDYSVFWGEWCIGRIYEKHSSPEHLRWFWSLFCPSRIGGGPGPKPCYANLMVPVSEPPPKKQSPSCRMRNFGVAG